MTHFEDGPFLAGLCSVCFISSGCTINLTNKSACDMFSFRTNLPYKSAEDMSSVERSPSFKKTCP
jgi:hypothetical protein